VVSGSLLDHAHVVDDDLERLLLRLVAELDDSHPARKGRRSKCEPPAATTLYSDGETDGSAAQQTYLRFSVQDVRSLLCGFIPVGALVPL